MLSEKTRKYINDNDIEIKIEYLEYLLEPIVMKLIERLKDKAVQIQLLMTIAEIAKRFKVTKAIIHNWIGRGTITGNKVGKNRYFTYD